MDRLVETIESMRGKFDRLRRHSLKETPTRTIVIDPLLDALGWDVRDPDEVQLEYPTVDGKSVDYALKINRKPVLLVEAKALDDPLDNVKSTAQVVGYAANDGIAWCVLTNGIKWKVYRSIEECPAPEKLMFEVSLDPRESEGLTPRQIGQKLWRFSCEEMAKGTLDELGEQTFTDGKVRKALEGLCASPPRPFLNLLRRGIGDDSLSPRKIGESLLRIVSEVAVAGRPQPERSSGRHRERDELTPQRGRRPKKSYDEKLHTKGKPQEILELYLAIDRFCASLALGGIEKRILAKYIAFLSNRRGFCSLHLGQGGLRVWVKLKYARLARPPSFARDVSNVGHWGVGDVELAITEKGQLEEACGLIRQSFESSVRT